MTYDLSQIKRKGAKVVYDDHDRFGLYLWQMPNGQYVGDGEGNFLNIPAEYGDIIKISKLAQAVRSYGVNEGKAEFFPGHRQVTDDEYDEQRARLLNGYVPDTEDIGALKDDLRAKKNKYNG